MHKVKTNKPEDSEMLMSLSAASQAVTVFAAGYQKQLQYRRSDGSYSAFGTKDAEGSVWLTAFVLKTFAKVRSYTYVDYSAYK